MKKLKKIKIVNRFWEDGFKPTLEEVRSVFEGKTDSNGNEFWYCYECGSRTTKPYNQCDDVYCLKCGKVYATYVTSMYAAGIIVEKLLKVKEI